MPKRLGLVIAAVIQFYTPFFLDCKRWMAVLTKVIAISASPKLILSLGTFKERNIPFKEITFPFKEIDCIN